MLEQAITPGYGLDVAGRGRECFMEPVVVLGGGLVTEERPPSAVECAAPSRAKFRNLAAASRAGLTNGTAYTLTITATDSSCQSPASQPSAAVTPRGR